jgi:hypothetical protein
MFFAVAILAVLPISAENGYVSIVPKDDGPLLEQNQVKLEIEGKEIPIQEFFFVDTAHPKPRTLMHPAGRRQYVILVDLIFSDLESIVQARKWADELVQKANKHDLFALAGITRLDGLKWYCRFTSDRNQIAAGWNAIGREKPTGVVLGPEGNFYSAQFEPNASIRLISDADFRQRLMTLAAAAPPKEEDRFIAVQGLVDLAELLSTIEGRKNLILFSPGFDTKGLSLNLDLGKRKRKSTKDTAETPSDPTSYDSITNSFRNIEEVAQAGPNKRPRQVGPEVLQDVFAGVDCHVFAVSPDENKNGLYENLVSKTAGVYYQGNFDPVQVLNTDRVYYIAGWASNIEVEKALNSLKIGAGERSISSSEKWMEPKPSHEYTNDEKQTSIAEAIFKDYSQPSETEHFWVDFYFEDGQNKIPVFAQVSGHSILQNKAESKTLEFYGYVLDADQSIIDSFSSIVEIDLKNDKLKERLQKTGLKVWNVLQGNQKPMLVRWIIIDSEIGRVVTHSMPIDVKESELTMSNPFIPATNFDWIIWPKPNEAETRRGVQVKYPYNMGQDYFFPDLTPGVAKGDKSRVVYFKLYNLLPESPNPPVRFHLLDAGGKAVEVQQFQLLQKPRALEHSGMELFWSVNSFPEVPPGPYKFRVDVIDPAKKGAAAGEIKVFQVNL